MDSFIKEVGVRVVSSVVVIIIVLIIVVLLVKFGSQYLMIHVFKGFNIKCMLGMC